VEIDFARTYTTTPLCEDGLQLFKNIFGVILFLLTYKKYE